MNRAIREKIRESLSSVLPITLVVFALCAFFVPLRLDALLLFLVGAALLIVGMGVFTLGVDMAMLRMGERIGATVTKRKNMVFLLITGFIVGFIATIAEPDLTVLAEKVQALPDLTLIITVAFGVGVALAVALWRIVKGFPLRIMLLICYIIVMILSLFAPAGFLPASFDSGGVTTGAMTVPYIMALGVGVASVRSDSESASDSFGLVALASVGPIIVMLLLGLILKPEAEEYIPVVIPQIMNSTSLFREFVHRSVEYFASVSISLSPLVVFYVLFQIFTRAKRPDKHELRQIIVGILYTYFGLVVFLTGINVGFMPAGAYLGEQIASMESRWVLVPLGMLLGYFIVATEPAVHVLVKQVEQMTEGAVSTRSIQVSLGIGVGVSIALAMVRVLTGLSLYWFILPGYAIALGLSFFSPKLFTAIAFDSGGVASGPMTAAFLLPFAIGASQAVGGNIAKDAFGLVSLVALTPLITIQVLGVYYNIKTREKDTAARLPMEDIIELDLPEEVMQSFSESTSVPAELEGMPEEASPAGEALPLPIEPGRAAPMDN